MVTTDLSEAISRPPGDATEHLKVHKTPKDNPPCECSPARGNEAYLKNQRQRILEGPISWNG